MDDCPDEVVQFRDTFFANIKTGSQKLIKKLDDLIATYFLHN